MTPPHIVEIARKLRKATEGTIDELSVTQSVDIATLAFSMSAEVFAKAIAPEDHPIIVSQWDEGFVDGQKASVNRIRTLASEEG